MKTLIASLLTVTLGAMLTVPANAAPEPKRIVLEQGTTHYVDQGMGDTIVLVHGLGADLSRWNMNIEALSETHRVIALDLYGFGDSSRLTGPYRAQTFVDQIETLRQGLGLERVSLVGNSMGGWVSMLYAEQYPEHVEKLVLVAPAFIYGLPETVTADRLANGANPQTSEQMRAYLSRVYSHPPNNEAEIKRLLSEHQDKNHGNAISEMARSIKASEDTLTEERVHTLTAPTLIIHGSADGIVPVEASNELLNSMQETSLIIYEQVGHWPQEEASERFNEDVMLFLRTDRQSTL